MVLQSSGAISLNDIQTEFGGTNPIGINEYYDVASGVPSSGLISFNQFYGTSAENWEIIMHTSGHKGSGNNLGGSTAFGNTGTSTFRSITADSTGAINRTDIGHGVGLYKAFFYKKNITKFALISGSGGQNNLQNPSSHGSYHVWDTFTADRDGYTNTGNESLYDMIKRLDTYNLNNSNWAGNNFDGTFSGASIRNFSSGTNGYSVSSANAYPNPPTMKDYPYTPPFSHTFTNAGATGRTGPTLTQVQNAYSGSGVSVSMNTQGIQLWTVPYAGDYEIEVAGARGGNSGNLLGGYGGRVKGTVWFSQGVVLAIIVGQAGADMPQNNWASGVGGGGASWVVNSNFSTPVYAVAGGGGGCNGASYVSQGAGWGNGVGTSGNRNGGALGGYGAGGGAGYDADGSGYSSLGGHRPANGAEGGDSSSQHSGNPAYTADGGFGGGGANGWHAGGGGGGYQGGDAIAYNQNGGAYGGTTFFSSTTSTTTYDYHTADHGYVKITAIEFSSANTPVPTVTAVPSRFVIWGINEDSDNDTQVLAAYSGTLAVGNGKSDYWRNNNPPRLYWSYWGNDWHSSSSGQTISVSSQTDPGVSTRVLGGHTGPVYLIAYGPPSEFPFSHTFTNAGATGRTGPTLTQIQNAYSSTSWASDTSKLNMTTQGYQIWTVPTTATYKFTIRGARGGSTAYTSVGLGGYARYISGQISLTAGTKLILVVGQEGQRMTGSSNAPNAESCGGGGGTFVVNENGGSHIPLLVAGGGGGGCADGSSGYADPWGNHVRSDNYSTYQIGNAYLNNGNGGGIYSSNYNGGGGGGWNSDGTSRTANYDGQGGHGWANGLTGGEGARYGHSSVPWFGPLTTGNGSGNGGFGGGGGAWINAEQRPGGGGGYSGGEGASYEQLSYNSNAGGGAGGNYINTTHVSLGSYGAQETSASHGSIYIEEILVPPGLYSFTTHTFTNAGATGRTGPTLTQCHNAYNVSWDTDTSFFNITTQGIQIWTVPATGTYEIEAAGAHGGSLTGTYAGNWGLGGDGGWCKGTLSLSSGTKLALIVGQAGLGGTSGWEGYGGGGASWVLSENLATLHAVGGGGGGAHGPVYGLWNNPTLSPSAGYDYFNGSVTYGGDGGNSQGSSSDSAGGGQGNYANGGGAGFTSDGAGDRAGQSTQCGGRTPANGAIGGETAYLGGSSSSYSNGKGGFGGGGGNGWHSGGGGGGYAGGDGGDLNCAACRPVGGGGGTTYSNLTGTTFGTHAAQMGYIKITRVS